MPRIAISPTSKLHDYEESIRRAGGEPWILDPATDRPADVIRAADGVLLPGGGDVLPNIYGVLAHTAFDAAEPGRDEFELEPVRRAVDADVPLFAICRGIQVLNVARGGTLVQHIPEEVGGNIDHSIKEPRFAIAHDIWMTPNTLLNNLMRTRLEGSEECQVNSRHHQAVKQLGEGLIATATAPDGVVEAVEDPSLRFCLGVQWHPENFYRTGEFSPLFEGFIKASQKLQR